MEATVDVAAWLKNLSLGQYEAAFRENEIDEAVLPNLTHESLVSQQSDTASGCSKPSLHCAASRPSKYHPQMRRAHRAPQAYHPKTAPSAAKSR